MAEIILSEGSAPSTPTSGRVSLYAKTDGLLYFKDDSGVEYSLGYLTSKFIVSGFLTPAQITGDQDNYNPTNLDTAAVLRLSSDGTSRNLTGLAGGQAGRILILHYLSGSGLVLVDESASSSEINRFALTSNITLSPDDCVILQYDSISSRWRAISKIPAAGSGITDLNGQTGATQSLARVNDTNVTLTITSATNTHTFTLGWTGTLALSRLVSASTNSVLLGRGDSSAGSFQEITLGSGLTMTGTTLSASGSGSSPLTTKGDIYTFTTVDARLPVGTNGQLLSANSATATGLEWATVGTLTDGDKGDITVSSSGTVWTIDATAVTLAKIQNITSDRLLGRDTAGAGVTEQLTVGGGVEFTGSGGIQRSALTGDVTASAGSNSTTIANDAVTYAKMQNVSASNRLLGRSTAGAGDVEEITVSGDVSQSGSTFTVISSSTTQAGKIEIATSAETTTGTDATRAVSPDGLAGSNYGIRVIGMLVSDPQGDALTTGDEKVYFRVPSVMNGWNLVAVAAHISTVSSSGAVTVQIRNVTDTVDMLSTVITIDVGTKDSSASGSPPVINTATDDVATGDEIAVDVDSAGTGVKGLYVELQFQLP